MEKNEAKNLVIKAGKRLVESGLIARTWGNVSCRIDAHSFLITPSGRDYLTLTPDEIVEVRIDDLSYSGDIKPSSEKGIHAEVYKFHSDINFVIHTHQEEASVISAIGQETIIINEAHPLLGETIVCAKYGLPGTKKLLKNVSQALKISKGNGIIMKYHGALCFGKDYDETFLVASELEKACHNYIVNYYLRKSEKENYTPLELAFYALENSQHSDLIIPPTNSLAYSDSKRTPLGFVLFKEGKSIEVENSIPTDSLSEEARLYRYIYEKNEEIQALTLSGSEETFSIACASITVKPILDDFAQIAGTVAKNVKLIPKDISLALKKSQVVFIENLGALCWGKSYDDAIAVSMVTEKNSKALIGASLFGHVKPINPLECRLMRFVYLRKYSKAISNK